jgi:hypothetical protein
MSWPLTIPLLWAQAGSAAAPAPEIPPIIRRALYWFFLYGEPSYTVPPVTWIQGLLGGWLTWIKAVSLLCLVGWVGSWLVTAIKERMVGRGKWYDYVAVAALIVTPLTVLVQVLQTVKQIPVWRVGEIPLVAVLGFVAAGLFMIWIEVAIWRTIRRFGRYPDLLVLLGIHVALGIGIGVGLLMQSYGIMPTMRPDQKVTWRDGVVYGARLSATYMGYVVFLRVLLAFCTELFAVRSRRLYSIARLSIYEANRRMWAPWVVIIVFGLVLAFTHWFLQPPRAAEMGRLFVGTLTLLCSLLLTAMVTILTPLSLPSDIQQQTIYTVVSKPVRRLEMVWGRMIGYMVLVTVLIVVFGGISLFYLRRTVGITIDNTEKAALRAKEENRTRDFTQLMEQADQLRSRMTARVPVKGSLSFVDSRGTPHAMGIDVGQEQSMKEPRSHIEGATPATAIWSYGIVPDPFQPAGRPVLLNRKIAVGDFLRSGTIEGLLNQSYELQAQITAAEREKSQPNIASSRISQLDSGIARNRSEFDRIKTEYETQKKHADDLTTQATAAETAGQTEQAQNLRAQAQRLRSDPIIVEMSFNVYRTTKGRIGDPVLAEIQVTNPHTGADYVNIFPIKEYYTNRQVIRPEILAGSFGDLKIEIRCISPTQYLGMAESDLYLLSSEGNFGFNYMKGLFGIWLQALVLTAIGVFAGTFLSWPVALLTTIAFFIAGQLAFAFLVDFTRQAILGGGPFESLIRLLTHDNQMSDLAPTAGAIIAKTLDSLVMPVMSMLVYIVPNFQALDVSNTVADGFAVSWVSIVSNTLLAVAYALPFSIVAYFILKNREVAA